MTTHKEIIEAFAKIGMDNTKYRILTEGNDGGFDMGPKTTAEFVAAAERMRLKVSGLERQNELLATAFIDSVMTRDDNATIAHMAKRYNKLAEENKQLKKEVADLNAANGFLIKNRDDIAGQCWVANREVANAKARIAELTLELRNGYMAMDQYQEAAMRTAKETNERDDKLVSALGLAGEAGEVADLIKKHVFHGHPLDLDKLEKELGDVMWYVATMAELVVGKNLSQVAQTNIDKLKKRYPDGFSSEKSINRGQE